MRTLKKIAGTQMREKILDDLARVAGGAAGVLGGMTGQIRSGLRSRVDDLAQRLDLVPREEFERIEAIAVEARIEQERLNARVAKLEALLNEKTKAAKPKQKRTKD